MIVPVASAKFSRFGALYIGSNVPGYFEAEGYYAFKVGARMLAAELQEWWLSFLRKDLLARAHVTDEELFLLAEERSGNQTKRIARDLGVSPQSVHSRFQRLNAKLHVPNKKAAARIAAEYGLI